MDVKQRQTAFQIKRGLDVPIAGVPEQRVFDAALVRSVALVGDDYRGIKPSLLIAEGETVRLGQPLFEDKNNPGVLFTAPGAGWVKKINRGARRTLQSVVIELDGDDEETFGSWSLAKLENLDEQTVRENLLNSGLWTAFRTRPFGRVPRVDSEPAAIFVTAIDTNPLAATPSAIIGENSEAFADGLLVLSRLTEGHVYVCVASGGKVPTPGHRGIEVVSFAGPHPAGLAGTHIHFVEPVSLEKTVWHVSYQDVMAIGRLFTTGRLDVARIVALGGPKVTKPRLLRTRLGASTEDLTRDELDEGPVRVVSGSVLSGRDARGWAGYLGRHHLQISIIAEGSEREFLGWLAPGLRKFSASRAFVSSLLRPSQFDVTTSQHGSARAMVPIGSFERVMPLGLLSTPLLKALLVGDVETAQALGCLELEEEDVALCSFVCCSKYDYGEALRECLTMIEQKDL